MAGAWEVQKHVDCLADGADNPKGLARGLASMSAVAEQRSKLQVCLCAVRLTADSTTACLLVCCFYY